MAIINCSTCGQAVGKNGHMDVIEVDNGAFEQGYPLCERCKLRTELEQVKGQRGDLLAEMETLQHQEGRLRADLARVREINQTDNIRLVDLVNRIRTMCISTADRIITMGARIAELDADLARVTAERDRLIEDCARISAEMGLPPAIGPAPGELRRILREGELATKRSKRLEEALTPSADTKAAYMGEFSLSLPDYDSEGNECRRTINVPWTTIKKIMAVIRGRALADELEGGE